MTFKRSFSTVLTAAAGAVIFAGAAMAQDTTTATPKTGDKIERHRTRDGAERGDRAGHEGFEGRHGRRGDFGMFRGLNLTDAQKAQMKQIREANKPNRADFEAIKPLMEAKRNGTITADQEAQLKAFRETRMANMKNVREQMLNVLTPEQKAQLEQNKANMKEKREEFHKDRELRRQQKQDGTVAKPVN